LELKFLLSYAFVWFNSDIILYSLVSAYSSLSWLEQTLILRIKSDCFLKQRWPINICNGDVLCFLCRRNWIFKYNVGELCLQGVTALLHVVQREDLYSGILTTL
jgi:hypothetical protein